MNKRKLGNTSMEVSEIAFGGVEIGMPYGIGIESERDMLSEKESIDLLHASMEAGVNFFDTARMYGNSEAIMGKAFAGIRKNILISTKCKHFCNTDGSLIADIDLEKHIEESLKESLAALQTDYIDVFMLHQADEKILDNEIIAETFSKIKARGDVRAIGASTYKISETKKVIYSDIWEVVQLPFNLMDQRQQDLFDFAAKQEKGIIIRSVLLKGLLSNRGKILHPALKEVSEHIKNYDRLFDDECQDLSSMALKFALSFSEVSSVLVGMDRLEYLFKSCVVANGLYMDKTRLLKARELAYPDPDFLNLHHWEKMGWLT